MLKQRVSPHWLPDGHSFWYRHELSDGGHEFVTVDPTTAERRPAFDHARLADALTKATGQPVAAQKLPITRIEPDGGEGLWLFGEEQLWHCDLRTYAVESRPRGDRPFATLRDPREPGATRRTGSPVPLWFTNHTAGTVTLSWMTFEGHRKKYADVAAGARQREDTFEGHVWVVTDPVDGVYAAFETPDGGGDFVLDAAAKPTPAPRKGAAPEVATSPDGRRAVFVKDHNLYVRDAGQGGRAAALSQDGTADDSYATDDIHWSPDSRKLVAMRTRKGDDHKVWLVESSPEGQLQPKLTSYDYLKPGDEIPTATPKLFDVSARTLVPIDGGLFPRPWSLTDLSWSTDSSRFQFLYNQRGHQVLRVVSVDAASGNARVLVDEGSKTFINYSSKLYLRSLGDGHELLWMSERSGYNHLYLYDADAGLVKNAITHGEWAVRRVERLDEKRRVLWFHAGGVRPGEDPYYLHLCRVNLDGSGFRVLTEGVGTHSVDLSPDRRFFVDTWSRVDQPPITEVRSAEDGRLVREIERADARRLLETGWLPPEQFVAKGRDGQTDIYGIVIRPRLFDPSRKYPVVEDIYASPNRASVPKAFGLGRSQRALADKGFIVVQIDGMGTSYRSKAFQDVAWKNLADSGFPDRIAWMRAAAAAHGEMDLTRVGIYGGSAGGQSAMRALLSHGDFYKVAVADSGCHDNRMDKIWWNEQWMGWPVDDSYARSSNVVDANKLQGKLLLIVGELDRNVDPSSTMQVVNALIKADKDFDLLVVPGGGHMVGDTPYGRRRRAEFFVRYLQDSDRQASSTIL